jgi:hypothetical protein
MGPGGEDGVCLHLWQGGRPRPSRITTEIHCHSWDLVSHVLRGHVRNEIQTVTDTATAPSHRIYEVISRGNTDEIRATPRTVRLGTPTATDHAAGDVYRLPAGAFHRSLVPGGTTTLTLAFGTGRRDRHDLSLGPLNAPSHRVTRSRCTLHETMGLAAGILATIRQPTAVS